MATGITAGKILRRGVESLGNDAMVYLLENKEHVQRINDDFDSRRTALLEQHTATQAEIAELEATEADLSAREAKLTEDRADLDTATSTAAARHQTDMGALGRRTREVVDKETSADARTEALDARENGIEAHGRIRETELAEREKIIEAREAACDDREELVFKRESGVTAREKSNETKVKQTLAIWR